MSQNTNDKINKFIVTPENNFDYFLETEGLVKIGLKDDKLIVFPIGDDDDECEYGYLGSIVPKNVEGYLTVEELKDMLDRKPTAKLVDISNIEALSAYSKYCILELLPFADENTNNDESTTLDESVNDAIAKAMNRVVEEGILTIEECEDRYNYCINNRVFPEDIIEIFNSMKKYPSTSVYTRKPKVLFVEKEIQKMLYRINTGDHIALYGPPATGKNTCVDTISWLYNRPLRTVSCSAQLDIEALFGKGGIKSSVNEDNTTTSIETTFQKGPVISAMENGEILVLDEINTANPDIIPSLNSVLDYRGMVDVPDVGRVISDKNFFTMVTFNKNLQGTTQLQEAFSSRFHHVELKRLNSIKHIIFGNIPNAKPEIVELVDKVYINLLQNVNSVDARNSISETSLCVRSLIRACQSLCDRNFDTRESLIEDLTPIATEEEDKVKIVAAIDNALNHI